MSVPMTKDMFLKIRPILFGAGGDLITFYAAGSDAEVTTDTPTHRVGWQWGKLYPNIEPLGDITKPCASGKWVFGENYWITYVDMATDGATTNYTIWYPADSCTSEYEGSRTVELQALDENSDVLGTMYKWSYTFSHRVYHYHDQATLTSEFEVDSLMAGDGIDETYGGAIHALRIYSTFDDTIYTDKSPALTYFGSNWSNMSMGRGIIG